jgi:flagellar assembly protein FliH
MGLIKASDAPSKLTVFSMRDIEAQARAIVNMARKRADEILTGARAEAVSILANARGDGFAKGKAEGLAEGIKQGKESAHKQALAEHTAAMTSLLQSLTAAAKDFETSRDDLQTLALREVVDLAAAIARRVTKRQGMIDPAVLSANVKEAMSLVVHSTDVRISLHPSQFKTFQEELPQLKIAWPQLKHIDVVADAAVSPGGARISTMHGQIDGDLDAQLDRVIHELMPETPALPETPSEGS